MLYSNSELLQAVNGSNDKAERVYKWAQGNPRVAMLNARELVKAYDKEHSEPQKEVNIKEMKVETKSTYGAVDLGEDKTSHPSNEAPQPLFNTYNKIKIDEPDDDLMDEVEYRSTVEYDIIYKKDSQYYKEDIYGSVEVAITKIKHPLFDDNYYITADGVVVRWVKRKGSYKAMSPVQSGHKHKNLYIRRINKQTDNREYVPVGVLVFKSFIDPSYDEKIVMFSDKNLHNLNLNNLIRKQ